MDSTPHTKPEIEQLAASVDRWFHSIDLGHGVITDGVKTPEILEPELKSLRLPDLSGKSVLDIGAWDGYYSFEAERSGASRVVALDHYVWSMDLPAADTYWKECSEKGITPPRNEESPFWQPASLPGKAGFNAAHQALGSKVESIVGNFMEMDISTLGTFDVVLYLGVLYHMENPLGSLQRIAALTEEMAIIETHAAYMPGYEDIEMCEFYSGSQMCGDISNWWAPNQKALEGMCRAAGFDRVEIIKGYDQPPHRPIKRAVGNVLRGLKLLPPLNPHPIRYYRAIAHAWK
jgi:tRNA (mo5U34)-methyltransferase